MGILAVTAWICPVCGYIHYGDTPPDECPVCGAPGSSFSPYTESQASTPAAAENAGMVVIVGGGIAGVSAAEAIRKSGHDARIVLLSAEPGLPYYRINLTRYLAGDVTAADLPLHPKEWYQDHEIELQAGDIAAAIHRAEKSVVTRSGASYQYGRLILATGANPFLPPIEGIGQKNVVALRTREDADLILSAARSARKFICVGGGILGLETAGAIARSGGQVVVLEALDWLMPRQLNQKAARLFESKVRRIGIELKTGVKIKAVAGEGEAAGVLLEDGTSFRGDMVVISAGVRSSVSLAREAGLNVNQGVVVDDRMQTSDPEIFAAGDAAEHNGILYGTWTPAQLQGSIAGMSAVNVQAAFPGVPRSNTLKVLGFDLYSAGLIAPETADDRIIEAETGDHYYGFVFRKGILAGAILLGNAALSGAVKKSIEDRVDFSAVLDANPSVDTIMDALKA